METDKIEMEVDEEEEEEEEKENKSKKKLQINQKKSNERIFIALTTKILPQLHKFFTKKVYRSISFCNKL